jgi:hypothetical protein
VFLAVGVHRVMRMRRNILSSVASPALLYFSTLSKKEMIVEKKVIELKMYVLIFSTTFGLKHFFF